MSVRDIVQAAAGAAVEENFLYGWGVNGAGQLGLNDRTSRSSPTQIGSDKDWDIVRAYSHGSSEISGANGCVLAIKKDGTLWATGMNTFGQLGLNDTTNRSSPVQVGSDTWQFVALGLGDTACPAFGIKTNGTLWSWGFNGSGQLGLNDRINRSSPVQIGALSNWSQVVPGGSTTHAIRATGQLYAWGDNGSGELGLNDRINRSSPVQVGALTNWAYMAGIGAFPVALKTDGTLWTWGNTNDFAPVFINRSSPVQMTLAGSGWAQVSSGNVVVALKTDGTLWSWGNNFEGTTGQNRTAGQSSSPIQIGSRSDWALLPDWAIRGVAGAITADGSLYLWGANRDGVLGDSTVINRSSPVLVGSGTTWKTFSSSGRTTFGITE